MIKSTVSALVLGTLVSVVGCIPQESAPTGGGSEQPTCGRDQHYNAISRKCVDDSTATVTCGADQHLVGSRCVDDEEEESCPEGMTWSVNHAACVSDSFIEEDETHVDVT